MNANRCGIRCLVVVVIPIAFRCRVKQTKVQKFTKKKKKKKKKYKKVFFQYEYESLPTIIVLDLYQKINLQFGLVNVLHLYPKQIIIGAGSSVISF
jgi:hypothetical protein